MTQQVLLDRLWTKSKIVEVMPFVEDSVHAVITSNVRLRRVNRETGEEHIEYAREHNTITNVAMLVNLFTGASNDHLDSGARLRILDSASAEIKVITGQRSGYPTDAASGVRQITLGWQDLTTDAYNPDDLYIQTPLGTTIAEALNVAFSNKLATENWFFDWDISLDSVDTQFYDGGLEAILDTITGLRTVHFDGQEAAANMWIEVYDADVGGVLLVTEIVDEVITKPTPESVRWRFTVTAGTGTGTWQRVELINSAPAPTPLYSDVNISRSKLADTQFTYQATLTLADS